MRPVPSTERTRRNVLAGSAAVFGGLLSGCVDGIDPRDSASNRTLTFQMEEGGRSLVDRYVVDLADTRVEWDETAFEAALAGDEFTTRHRRPFPVRNGDGPLYTFHDGTYYHLDSVVIGEERATHPVLRLFEEGRSSESDGLPDHTAHEDLPSVDRQAVSIAHMAARARGNEGGVPWGLVERGGYVYRSDARSQSRLLDESGPSHVAYQDFVYRCEVTEETFHEAIYRPDVEPVAGSASEMETVLRATLLDSRIDPASLTAEEREIVRTARGDGYEETHPFSEALTSLLEALDQRAYVDGDVEKDGQVERNRSYLLEYGSEYFRYWLQLGD